MPKKIIDQDRLKELLHYDPETGEFRWIDRKKGRRPGKFGYIATDGYRQAVINYVKYKAHRLAFVYMTGSCPVEVDHIDGDRLNNSWSNLRAVTHKENGRNMRLPKDNKSGLIGVFWSEKNNRWLVNIGGKYLGCRSHMFEAACLRKSAENNHGYHENHGS